MQEIYKKIVGEKRKNIELKLLADYDIIKIRKEVLKMNNKNNFATPKLDLVFKKIFGDIANSDLLTSFLCAVLKDRSQKHKTY